MPVPSRRRATRMRPLITARLAIALSLAATALLAGAARAPRDANPQTAATLNSKTDTKRIAEKVPEIPKGLVVKVGVCDLPPWSTQPGSDDPAWSGLAVQLWKRVAQNLQLQYEVQSFTYAELKKALADQTIDIAATGIPIEAENLIDFTLTPAFDQSGISIATREREPLTILGVLARLWEPEIFSWLVIIVALVVVFGVVLWMTERKRNPPFEGHALSGIAEGSWLSVSTLTTVGYGDRVPVTLTGKIVAALWMLIGFVLLTTLSGVVTSVLTVQRLAPMVTGPGDLLKARVGAVEATAGETYLRNAGIDFVAYKTYEAAVLALENRGLDAIVGSTASLGYLTQRSSDRNLVLLARPLMREYVAMGERFGLDPGLEKRIELEVVRVMQAPDYRAYRDAVMGESSFITGTEAPRGRQ